MRVTASATIEGSTTNRVQVRGPRGGISHKQYVRCKKCCGTPWGEAHKVGCERAIRRERRAPRYRADRTRGAHPNPAIATSSPTKVIAISIALDELAELDAHAEQRRMSRSHFIREAVRTAIESREVGA